MTARRDSGERAISTRFNASRVAERTVDELIGLCRGVLADGVVAESEAEYLLAWLEANRAAADSWPGNVLYERVAAALADGRLDPEEEAELLDTLNEATGLGIPLPEQAASYSTALPLCSPPPEVVFPGRSFVLTGKFVHGSRRECQTVIEELGGLIKSKPTRDVDYLVVGAIGSRDWIHSTHGRKIEEAVKLRDAGTGIRIIGEEHWARFVA